MIIFEFMKHICLQVFTCENLHCFRVGLLTAVDYEVSQAGTPFAMSSHLPLQYFGAQGLEGRQTALHSILSMASEFGIMEGWEPEQ